MVAPDLTRGVSSTAMRPPLLALLPLVAVFTVANGCGPDITEIWLCLNPATGYEDSQIYDANHYVNGVLDPCHCYDPCGPEKSCPMAVDAGPPPADAGCMGDGGDGG